jgi:hypothetical protein
LISFRGEVLAKAGTEEMILYSDIGEICSATLASGEGWGGLRERADRTLHSVSRFLSPSEKEFKGEKN